MTDDDLRPGTSSDRDDRPRNWDGRLLTPEEIRFRRDAAWHGPRDTAAGGAVIGLAMALAGAVISVAGKTFRGVKRLLHRP